MIRFIDLGEGYEGLEVYTFWGDSRRMVFCMGFEWTGTEYEYYSEDIVVDTGHPETNMDDQAERCVNATIDFAKRHVKPELMTDGVVGQIREKAAGCVIEKWKQAERETA